MFLEHLLKFGLVKDTGTSEADPCRHLMSGVPESNVLSAYPLESRRVFAQQTVQLLLEQTVPWTEISSARCVALALADDLS